MAKEDLLHALEKASGLPAKQWAGKCFQMATCLVRSELVSGVAVYGHWVGPVEKGSYFDPGAKKPPVAFVQHGWVKDGKTVIDPTRWTFENKKPYVYIGESDHYDEGGNRYRQSIYHTAPKFDYDAQPINLERKMSVSTWRFVQSLLLSNGAELPNPQRMISFPQLVWLANQPPRVLEEHAATIYETIAAIGRRALIPIDNLRMVERGNWM